MDGTCSTSGWKNVWQVPLRTVSILAFSLLLARVQGEISVIPITWEPLFPVEGHNVVLRPGGAFKNVVFCSWYRGLTSNQENKIFTYYLPPHARQVNGPSYTGQETVDSRCSLHLKNLTTTDSGNYTVVEGGPGSFKFGHAHLIISEFLAKPAVSAQPSPILGETLGSVSLTCITSSTLSNIHWLWNGQLLAENPRIQLSYDNRTLSLQSALRGDAGMYQCQVANLAGSVISDVAYIEVIYGPDPPVIQPDERFHAEHSDIKLSCTASIFPSGRYVWFFNSQACGRGPELLIHDITLEKTGTYTCQVENMLTLQRRNTTLEIKVVPSHVHNITISGPSEAIENQPASLHCASVGFEVSYSWFKEGQKLGAGGRVSFLDNNQTLMFSPSSQSDAGSYSCLASNSLSSNSSDPHVLDIIYGPDIPVIHEEVFIQRSKVRLSCRAISFPEANYVWFLNGKELPNKADTIVRDFAPEDSGNYTCQAENVRSRQKTNTTIVINMLGKRRDIDGIEEDEERVKL